MISRVNSFIRNNFFVCHDGFSGSMIQQKPRPPHHGGRPPRGGSRFHNRPFQRPGGKGPSLPPVINHVATQPAPKGKLRIAVLGGCEEVGRNCTLIEYENDIILIDMGLQFPEEDMPGIDYIIPNMSYLRGKEKNVRGVVITHGHYDHIGAIPHTIPHIGNPPLFGLPITLGIIKKRQTDFQTTPPLQLNTVKIGQVIQLGVFRVSLFHINHSIPDAAGILVETPVGNICHTGDWKFDFHPAGTVPADFQRIAEIGKKGVLCLMGDSTNAGVPGHQISERDIGATLEHLIEKAPGRIIIGTFASLLSRVKQIIEISERLGRKVALDGYSMKTNVEIAKELGYIKASMKTFIPIDQVEDYPSNKVTIICTGAQGERNAALMRIANDEHRSVKVVPGDTIVFSSSVIPGNERSVQRVKDIFYRKRARVVHYQMMDVHAGGHAQKEDIKLMLSLFKPKYYIPIEGNHFLLRENAEVAYSLGWKEEMVFVVDNGQIVEFVGPSKEGETGTGVQTKERIPADYVFVDGLGVGDVSQVVLRDRQALAEDGMVIVITQIDGKTGKLTAAPDIISRGFVFMHDQQNLIEETRNLIKKIIDQHGKANADLEHIKNTLRNDLGTFLFQKTERRPMILPVVIEV